MSDVEIENCVLETCYKPQSDTDCLNIDVVRAELKLDRWERTRVGTAMGIPGCTRDPTHGYYQNGYGTGRVRINPRGPWLIWLKAR